MYVLLYQEYLNPCENHILPRTCRQPARSGDGCHVPPIQFGVVTTPTCFSREVKNLLFMNQGTASALPQSDAGGECKNCAGIVQEKVQIHPWLYHSPPT
jgi:hypothetical protein